jgi:hypothetical protein
LPTRPKPNTRPPNPAERDEILRSFDTLRLSVRGANDLADTAGIKYGDRVAIYLEATCVDVDETTSREGLSERLVVLEVYDGHPLQVIDEQVGRRRKRRRRKLRAVE